MWNEDLRAEHQRQWGSILREKILISHEKEQSHLKLYTCLFRRMLEKVSIIYKLDCSEHLASPSFF